MEFLIFIVVVLFLIRLISSSKKRTKSARRIPDYTVVTGTRTNRDGQFIPQNEILGADYMDGHDFEYWCADLLLYSSFTDINVTRASNDQGVDIIARYKGEKFAIQCKRYSSRLGNTPIQEVCAGRSFYGCDRAAVMTNNYFTNGAIQLAKATNVYLWDRDSIMELLNNKQEYLRRQTAEYKREQREKEKADRKKKREERRAAKKSNDNIEYSKPTWMK